MKKIEFVNGQAPYLNEQNLNQLQDNMEEVSVPDGGTSGQVLMKGSNTDNDVVWGDNVLTVTSVFPSVYAQTECHMSYPTRIYKK